MTTTLDVQRALIARGYDIGPSGADGAIGPATLTAILRALDGVPRLLPKMLPKSFEAPKPAAVVPADWMPWAQMTRIVVHWTGGGHMASDLDRRHYHVLIEGPGNLVRGIPSIDLNQAPLRPGYAAHTLNCNSDAIAVALCGMAGAIERPFSPGSAPILREQWDKLPAILADLCRRYAINVTPGTVLSHAEVQATLGIKQKGKWDIARLPFDASLANAKAIGDAFRARALARL